MATETNVEPRPAEDVINDVVEQVGALCDRIITLRVEGNTDGAAELGREAETIISENLKGNRKGFVAARKTCRTGVARALETEPAVEQTSTEVEVAPARPEWMTKLMEMGSDRIRVMAETKVRGGAAVAELILDMRRRVQDKDGFPDLMGKSHEAKSAASEMYDRVREELANEPELAGAVDKVQTDVRRALKDIRVSYAKRLDDEDNPDRELFAAVKREEGQSLSEAVAAHYGFRLLTLAELEAERRANKELESGSAGGDDSDESGAELVGELVGPTFESAVKAIAENLKVIRKIQDTGDLTEAERAKTTEIIDALVNELTAARAEFTG
jgi:hypothetical protein